MVLKMLKARIAQGKKEIRADIKAGTIPATITSFGELHDYVDANEYGGLCEDAIYDSMGSEVEWIGLCNQVQDALDAWIKKGMK